MTDVRLSVGDGDVTDDLALDGVTGYGVQNGTFSAPVVQGARYRVISWSEEIRGSTGDDLWAKVAAIQSKLTQAAQAQGAYGHGTRVTLSIKLGDASNYVYADVVNGSIDIPQENISGPLVDNAWVPIVNVTLLCEPYLRGTAVTTTVSGTITATAGTYATPGNTGSGGLFISILGDVPALCRHILTDVSTGSQITQRYRISAFSLRDPATAIVQADFTPWVDDTPAGAGSVTSDATAVGSAGSQITLSSVMRRVASYAKPSAAYMTGLFDVWLRVKDSNAILGAPTLTGAGVQNDVNMYIRQAITTNTAGATSLSPTWDEETKPGSTLLIGVGIKSRTITITTPTDFTASAAAVAHGTGSTRVAWFYIENSAARSGAEAVAFSSSVAGSAVMLEIVGAAIGGAAVDVETTATAASTTISVASGTLAQAREMVFAVCQMASGTWNAAATSGFTDITAIVQDETLDFSAAYARSTATTTQNVTFDPVGSPDTAAALIGIKQAANLAPNIALGTYEIAVVAASAGGTSLSPVSNVIAVTVTQTDSVIYAEWDLGAGSPDHHRLHYRILGGVWEYHASPASSGAYTAYIIPDDGGTVGDPPTISSNASNVRVAVALSSGTTVYNSKTAQTQVGSGAWEWLYVATVPLPPMPASDGSTPRSWILYAEASHPLPSGTIDFDVAVFVPHPLPSSGNRHYVESEYVGLNLGTLRAHKIETRRDGRTFGYLTASGGDTEAGQLSVTGDSLGGPGPTWFTVIPDVAAGASDVVNTKYTHQIVYTPRFIWLRGT